MTDKMNERVRKNYETQLKLEELDTMLGKLDAEREKILKLIEETESYVEPLIVEHASSLPFIRLDHYEISNLRAAIEAICPSFAGVEKVTPNPLDSLNTGDWLGQIYYKLPTVECKPNRSATDMRKAASPTNVAKEPVPRIGQSADEAMSQAVDIRSEP